MEKGWKQTWKNLLFQHFVVKDINSLEKYLPKNCEFDSFEGKYYLGLVYMNMTNVRHKSTGEFIWFDNYNELNVRTYIKYKGKRGVLFLSLDVDSIISFLGARVFYGLPYRLRNFITLDNEVFCYKNSDLQFKTKFDVVSEAKKYEKESFAFWATERYFFAQKYLGISFIGNIEHEQWELCEAVSKNANLNVLDKYEIVSQYPDILYCDSIEVQTNKLQRI